MGWVLMDHNTLCVVAFGGDMVHGAQLVWDLTRNSRRSSWLTLEVCDETSCRKLSSHEELLAFVDAHLSDEAKMECAL